MTRDLTGVLVAAVLGVAMLILPAGCGYWSLDRYTYDSRTWSPKTVTLVDTRSNEELWRKEVPVGSKLVIKFDDSASEDPVYPDRLLWWLTDAETRRQTDSGEVPSPPEGVRLVRMFERDAPEYPREDTPEATPKPLPMEPESPDDTATQDEAAADAQPEEPQPDTQPDTQPEPQSEPGR